MDNMVEKESRPKSEDVKEQRVRKITSLYYSRKDVQNAIFQFSKNREVVPRYFEGFGKRPDTLQYPGDVFEMVKKGATSFHCSEEIWKDPLAIVTGMSEKQLNNLREGWDLLLDIDSKYLDYSKILAKHIIHVLNFYGIKNIGMKFSGSKGFHIIVPWKAFPDEVNEMPTKEMFPVWPRIVTQFIMEACKEKVAEEIYSIFNQEKYGSVMKYVKKDKGSSIDLSGSSRYKIEVGSGAGNTFTQNKFQKLELLKQETGSKEVLPDLVLVSSRHLFRAPYSLHEKTALCSTVVLQSELENFQPKDADPLKAVVRDFMPDAREGEASELLREALDWYKNKALEHGSEANDITNQQKNVGDYKPIKIDKISEEILPESIKKILLGIKGDGRKRALFILINFFRSIGMEKADLEAKISEWNSKNEIPLKEGYIVAQLQWSYRNKVSPPPNYDKDHYAALGITPTDEEKRYKNPLNYTVKKSLQLNSKNSNSRKTKRQSKKEPENSQPPKE